MKTFVVVLLIAACAAVAQIAKPIALNPKRVSAIDIVQEGDATHFRGDVKLNLESLMVYCEELEYRATQWQIATRGDARLALQKGATDYTHLDVSDPRRFRADDIRQDGDLIALHGNVKLDLPGWEILAVDAVVDRAKATITVHGDATLVALKPGIEGVPDNTLGRVFITE